MFLSRKNIQLLGNIAREAGVTHSVDIPIFGNVVQKVRFVDKDTGMAHNYYRYWLPAWQWFVGDYELTLGANTYPAGTWSITSIYVQCTKSEVAISPVKAMVELNLDGTIKYLPPEYIYYGDMILYADERSPSLPCTLVIDNRGSDEFKRWHIVYLSPHVRSLLAIRLFLFDEPGAVFERVYPISDASAEDSAAQVWKIYYPDDIEAKPEYLRLDSIAPTNF